MTEQQRTDFINRWCDEHPIFPDLRRPGWARPVGEKSPTIEDCLKDMRQYELDLERGRLGFAVGGGLK